jgi:hypothetical protein
MATSKVENSAQVSPHKLKFVHGQYYKTFLNVSISVTSVKITWKYAACGLNFARSRYAESYLLTA